MRLTKAQASTRPYTHSANMVPVGPLREAVEELVAREGEGGWSKVCSRLEWMINPSRARPDRRSDVTRLRRRLGIVPQVGANGVAKCSTHMRYESAVEIVRGLGWDPVDFDL